MKITSLVPLLEFIHLMNQVWCSVDLEFEVVSFANPNSKLISGDCCFGKEGSRGRCPLTCRTFFTACAYGSSGNCQTKHYTHLQSSGVMGNSTFGSNAVYTGKNSRYVIRGKTRENIQVWCSVDLEFEVVSFANPNSKLKSGECCFGKEGSRGRCPLTCRTFFTACAYGSSGNCQTRHYTHLQSSGVMGNSTFGSNAVYTGKNSRYVIRGKTRENIQEGVTLDIEANNKDSSSSNSSLIAEFRVDFGDMMGKLNSWSSIIRSDVLYSSGRVSIEVRGRVSCSENFFGSDCEKKCVEEPLYNQVCDEKGHIICAPGYGGPMCDQPICDEGCENGFCGGPNKCVCHPGFSGPTCGECVTSPGCKHGYCSGQRPSTCSCEVGWGGNHCDIDLEYCTRMKPCVNGGKCLAASDADSLFKCQCPDGFSGAKCQHSSSCSAPGYCQNGGSCLDPQSSICECPKTWTGARCDVIATCDIVSCQNGATCERSITTNELYCACPTGYVGSFCEIEDPCETRDNEPACKNDGICISHNDGTFECLCERTFVGSKCETPAYKLSCDQNPCQNGGSCIKFANDVRCNCANGYTGSFCTIKRNPCHDNPCLNGAKCISTDNDSYKCRCQEEFFGKYCQYRNPNFGKVDETTSETYKLTTPESSHPIFKRPRPDSQKSNQSNGVKSEEIKSEGSDGNSFDLNLELNVEENELAPMAYLLPSLIGMLVTSVTILSVYFLMKRICRTRNSPDQRQDSNTWDQLKDMPHMRNNSQQVAMSSGNFPIEVSTSHQPPSCSIKINNLERAQNNRDIVRNNRNSTVPEKWAREILEPNLVSHQQHKQTKCDAIKLKEMIKADLERHPDMTEEEEFEMTLRCYQLRDEFGDPTFVPLFSGLNSPFNKSSNV